MAERASSEVELEVGDEGEVVGRGRRQLTSADSSSEDLKSPSEKKTIERPDGKSGGEGVDPVAGARKASRFEEARAKRAPKVIEISRYDDGGVLMNPVKRIMGKETPELFSSLTAGEAQVQVIEDESALVSSLPHDGSCLEGPALLAPPDGQVDMLAVVKGEGR